MNLKTVILIGNSDGIGYSTTERLLSEKYRVIGFSKSKSNIIDKNYTHYVLDVCEREFRDNLEKIDRVDICIYFAGIGDELNFSNLQNETKTFRVNLMGAVDTTEIILRKMLYQNEGHFIGISSVADILTSSDSPSYCASKVAASRYWEGLGLALSKDKMNVFLTNIRFGFVDTKMAKSPIKPFLLSKTQAVNCIMQAISKPKIRITKPKLIVPLVHLINFPASILLLFK